MKMVKKCTLSDLYLGSVILPKGSISQILIDRKGTQAWRVNLIGFNKSDCKVEKVASIYSQENNCKNSIDEFLSANIKSVYQLIIENDNLENGESVFQIMRFIISFLTIGKISKGMMLIYFLIGKDFFEYCWKKTK